ncbi:hypothetical protein GGS20DRAFT_527350 [Poronia punctata]|nr:hypothetical protein GGS20DRAFT_527350 [Poronia punctata]
MYSYITRNSNCQPASHPLSVIFIYVCVCALHRQVVGFCHFTSPIFAHHLSLRSFFFFRLSSSHWFLFRIFERARR